MEILKQSTAVTKKMGPFLDSADGDTEKTALTIAQADIRLSKNGGAFAQSHNAAGATHDEHGYYGVPLDTTDTAALGSLRVAIHVAGALAVWQDFLVVPAAVYNALAGSGGGLPIDWANVLNPTTTLDLSGTTVATVSGNVSGSVVGTVGQVASMASGGRDAIAASILSATADGVALSKIFEVLMAAILGKASVSGSTVTYKRRDGTTTSLTVTIGSTPGQRTGSTIA